MQATSSPSAKSSYQQSQQEAHEDDATKNQAQANHSSLNTSADMNGESGRDNDGSNSSKNNDKKPIMVTNPISIKLEGMSSEVMKNQVTPTSTQTPTSTPTPTPTQTLIPTPISPRGVKPIPRLPLPDAGKNPKSPRSPRTDQPRNGAEQVPKSPGRDEIIHMADSVADAYRAFGSPRKEQPTPQTS